jgi:FixJ family two-component response regulator
MISLIEVNAGELDFQTYLAEVNIRVLIVTITGHGVILMPVRTKKVGADDFMTKAFRDQSIAQCCRRRVSEQTGGRGARAR